MNSHLSYHGITNVWTKYYPGGGQGDPPAMLELNFETEDESLGQISIYIPHEKGRGFVTELQEAMARIICQEAKREVRESALDREVEESAAYDQEADREQEEEEGVR